MRRKCAHVWLHTRWVWDASGTCPGSFPADNAKNGCMWSCWLGELKLKEWVKLPKETVWMEQERRAKSQGAWTPRGRQRQRARSLPSSGRARGQGTVRGRVWDRLITKQFLLIYHFLGTRTCFWAVFFKCFICIILMVLYTFIFLKLHAILKGQSFI